MNASHARQQRKPGRAPRREMAASSQAAATAFSFRKIDIVLCVALVALVAVVFAQTFSYPFVNYDDETYITRNPTVIAGLTAKSMERAFTQPHATNWHPITTLSHMLDCQLFGLNAGRHHLINVALHATTAVLLFLCLMKLTLSRWRSAFVAAVFAIHPLRVESVAWVAERKDVLSGLFFVLTLIAYVWYARRPSIVKYVVVMFVYALGLMSKVMLVTTPFVLLLLDWWPLDRITTAKSMRRPILEKLPLLAFAGAAAVVTYAIQLQSLGAIPPLPIGTRVGNALYTLFVYARQLVWPGALAAFYPHPDTHLTLFEIATGAVFLVVLVAAAFAFRKRLPYLVTGLGWYVVMLVPVIGIVQVGLQGRADRYTYLPHIGLTIALTWLIADLTARWRYQRAILFAAAVITMSASTATAYLQTQVWRDSESLWRQALLATQDNDVAHENLGRALMSRGDVDDAIAQFRAAVSIHANDSHPHYALGRAIVHTSLGEALAEKQDMGAAMSEFHEAIALQPQYPDAHYDLGILLAGIGDVDGAMKEWQATLSIQPNDSETRTHLASALLQKHEIGRAVEELQTAIAAPVPSMSAFNNLAWILATSPNESRRRPTAAMQLAQDLVIASRGQTPAFLRTFAAAAAANGEFDVAIATAEHALTVAGNDAALAREIAGDLKLYRQRVPLRDSSLAED